MSKLTAPMKEDVTHDSVALLPRYKIKGRARLYTTQLVPGHHYLSYEGISVNLEPFSFRDGSTSRGTSYERLELYSFHDNRSYEEVSITLERLIFDGYEELYVELELTGFHDNRGYVYRDASQLCDESYEEYYSGVSELFSFCGSGGSHDECSDGSGPSDIQDSDNRDDALESRCFPPLFLFCDGTGKLSSSGKQRCDLRVVVEQVSTDSLAYLSGRAEDCPVKALDVDSLHTDPSIQNGAFLQSRISTKHSYSHIELQNEWKLTKAEEEAKLERKQQREALVACNIEADN